MKPPGLIVRALFALVLLLLGISLAGAQNYPDRPVKFKATTPQEFADYIRSEGDKWARVVKRSGAQMLD